MKHSQPASFKNKLTVCLTIDEDGDTAFQDAGHNSVTAISRANYGPHVGLKRVVNLLKKYKLPATCFIPGVAAEQFGEQYKIIPEAGIEIGHHGYTHRSPNTLSIDEERMEIERGLEALYKIFGIRPKGYRAPWLQQSENTYQLLTEFGLDYDSSECSRESPFYLETARKRLVEIPCKYELIDTPLFFNITAPGLPPFPVDPEAIEKIWKAEFIGMYESDEDLCYVHVVHPGCIGHFSRLKAYENLIEFMMKHPGVTFLSLGEVSHRFLSS